MLSVSLILTLMVPLGAQKVLQSNAGRSLGAAYDAAHETTLTGTIQMVATGHEAGSPVGMRVLVSSSLGSIDAHLGPYWQDLQTLLRAGTEVQLTGSMDNLQGKQILLVRQLRFPGRTITVRSLRGFLVRSNAMGATAGSENNGDTGRNGGSR